MSRRLAWIIVIVLIVSALSFARSFLGLIGVIPWHYGYSDVFNEDRINPEIAKKIPYLESPVEYPVVTGFFIYFMWLLGKNLLGYALFTWIFLSLFTVITVLILYRLCELHNISKSRLLWFFIFAPSLIIFSIYNWDIIAVMFMVVAIYFFYKGNYYHSAIFLGLGFSAKLFPIVLLPIMMLKAGFKNAVKMLLIFLGVFLILNGYFIINSFEVWKTTFTFHSAREPNIDSIWALSGLSTNTINILSLILFLAFYLILAYNHKRYDLITLCFASLLVFLIFNKIFSPQYILWLLPLFVLLPNMPKKAFYSLEISNLAVFFLASYYIFSSKNQIWLNILNALVIARSLVLAYLVFAILKIKNFKNIS